MEECSEIVDSAHAIYSQIVAEGPDEQESDGRANWGGRERVREEWERRKYQSQKKKANERNKVCNETKTGTNRCNNYSYFSVFVTLLILS